MQFVSFWNRVYYSLYDFHYFWSEYLLGRILERMHRPFYSSVTQEEYDEIRGIIKNLKENPKGGLLMIYTSYSMTYILVGIEICIICMLQMIAGINCWSIGIIPLLIIIGGLSMLFCYFMLWKKDRYLENFQKYRKESIRKRTVWVVATQLFCILLFVIFLWILKHPHEFPGLFTPVAS